MKFILIILIGVIGGSEDEFKGNISEFNKIKKEAEFAYNDEDYLTASEKYSYLIDSLNYNNDNARLNLAHSYYKMDEMEKAKNIYGYLANSENKEVRSIANQQLGVFESRAQNLQKSLQYFKESLRADPYNEESRYNYELVKKKLDEQKDQNQDQKQDQQDEDKKNEDQKKDQKQENKDKQNKEQQQDKKKQEEKEQDKRDQQKQEDQKQEQEKQDKEQQQQGEKDKEQEQKPEDKQNEKKNPDEEKQEQEQQAKPMPQQPNFDEKEISKEMAEMILQAMRNKELQYLQQIKRKPSKPVDKDKPDW